MAQNFLEISSDLSEKEDYEDKDSQSRIDEYCPEGRFIRFNEELGFGAFKVVYKAYDNETGCEVAWNVIKLQRLTPSESKRISEEITILKNLNHPNIMNFITAWINSQKNQVVFITECVSGGSLKKQINNFFHLICVLQKEHLKKIKKPRLKIIKNWCRQILKGLVYLHSQKPFPIIHRDIKCENIFINTINNEIRIGDLGLAISLKNSSHTTSVIGTPEFMAPEIYEEKYGTPVDIYSFGMCVLEMATLTTPYKECTSQAQVYKKVSSGILPTSIQMIKNQGLKNIILECLSSSVKRPSAQQLLEHPYFQSTNNEEDNHPVQLIDDIPSNSKKEGQPNQDTIFQVIENQNFITQTGNQQLLNRIKNPPQNQNQQQLNDEAMKQLSPQMEKQQFGNEELQKQEQNQLEEHIFNQVNQKALKMSQKQYSDENQNKYQQYLLQQQPQLHYHQSNNSNESSRESNNLESLMKLETSKLVNFENSKLINYEQGSKAGNYSSLTDQHEQVISTSTTSHQQEEQNRFNIFENSRMHESQDVLQKGNQIEQLTSYSLYLSEFAQDNHFRYAYALEIKDNIYPFHITLKQIQVNKSDLLSREYISHLITESSQLIEFDGIKKILPLIREDAVNRFFEFQSQKKLKRTQTDNRSSEMDTDKLISMSPVKNIIYVPSDFKSQRNESQENNHCNSHYDDDANNDDQEKETEQNPDEAILLSHSQILPNDFKLMQPQPQKNQQIYSYVQQQQLSKGKPLEKSYNWNQFQLNQWNQEQQSSYTPIRNHIKYLQTPYCKDETSISQNGQLKIHNNNINSNNNNNNHSNEVYSRQQNQCGTVTSDFMSHNLLQPSFYLTKLMDNFIAYYKQYWEQNFEPMMQESEQIMKFRQQKEILELKRIHIQQRDCQLQHYVNQIPFSCSSNQGLFGNQFIEKQTQRQKNNEQSNYFGGYQANHLHNAQEEEENNSHSELNLSNISHVKETENDIPINQQLKDSIDIELSNMLVTEGVSSTKSPLLFPQNDFNVVPNNFSAGCDSPSLLQNLISTSKQVKNDNSFLPQQQLPQKQQQQQQQQQFGFNTSSSFPNSLSILVEGNNSISSAVQTAQQISITSNNLLTQQPANNVSTQHYNQPSIKNKQMNLDQFFSNEQLNIVQNNNPNNSSNNTKSSVIESYNQLSNQNITSIQLMSQSTNQMNTSNNGNGMSNNQIMTEKQLVASQQQQQQQTQQNTTMQPKMNSKPATPSQIGFQNGDIQKGISSPNQIYQSQLPLKSLKSTPVRCIENICSISSDSNQLNFQMQGSNSSSNNNNNNSQQFDSNKGKNQNNSLKDKVEQNDSNKKVQQVNLLNLNLNKQQSKQVVSQEQPNIISQQVLPQQLNQNMQLSTQSINSGLNLKSSENAEISSLQKPLVKLVRKTSIIQKQSNIVSSTINQKTNVIEDKTLNKKELIRQNNHILTQNQDSQCLSRQDIKDSHQKQQPQLPHYSPPQLSSPTYSQILMNNASNNCVSHTTDNNNQSELQDHNSSNRNDPQCFSPIQDQQQQQTCTQQQKQSQIQNISNIFQIENCASNFSSQEGKEQISQSALSQYAVNNQQLHQSQINNNNTQQNNNQPQFNPSHSSNSSIPFIQSPLKQTSCLNNSQPIFIHQRGHYHSSIIQQRQINHAQQTSNSQLKKENYDLLESPANSRNNFINKPPQIIQINSIENPQKNSNECSTSQ